MNWTKLFAHNSDKLKSMIAEHPNYPIIILANEDANNGDYSEMFCSRMDVYIGEYLDVETPFSENFFTDKDCFEEELCDWLEFDLEERGFICSKEYFEHKFEKEVNKYEPFWKPCIFLHVGN